MTELTVGGLVAWTPEWGYCPTRVTAIEREGVQVETVDPGTIGDHEVVMIDLASGQWAYPEQLIPLPEPDEGGLA